MLTLRHGLRLSLRRDEKARADFVSALRRHVFETVAGEMRRDYREAVAPRLAPDAAPEDIHATMRGREAFQFYSALRVGSQEMVYQAIRPAIERAGAALQREADELAHGGAGGDAGGDAAKAAPLGSLTLEPGFAVPRSVSAVDIHLSPGSYVEEYAEDDLAVGAVYDNRLAISTFGVFGPNLDDIGQSIARFVLVRHPQFAPRRILDLGCTVGHNTGAWKDVFPEAEVHGIDVAAPCLRYAAARARSQGRAVHFRQMDAEALRFPDASFDVVFSSMFLHEVPRKGIPKVLREAYRVLRPGGLMLHMELPPADQLSAYDSFYLDWDGHYNNEPFYRAFRAMDLRRIVATAGFAPDDYLQHVVPSWSALGADAWRAAVDAPEAPVASEKTGRLATGIRWFCFGAWKR
ncbi:MAG: methyltransferase domain-containing protein [Gammaproteobacteria bacterium]|jgi:SAM-dependent methyltransferase